MQISINSFWRSVILLPEEAVLMILKHNASNTKIMSTPSGDKLKRIFKQSLFFFYLYYLSIFSSVFFHFCFIKFLLFQSFTFYIKYFLPNIFYFLCSFGFLYCFYFISIQFFSYVPVLFSIFLFFICYSSNLVISLSFRQNHISRMSAIY